MLKYEHMKLLLIAGSSDKATDLGTVFCNQSTKYSTGLILTICKLSSSKLPFEANLIKICKA